MLLIPLAKNIKRYFSYKEIIIVTLAIVISVSAGVGIFLNLKSDVMINDCGKQIVVKTMKTTVKEVLEQNGIKVSNYDYLSVPLSTKLKKIGVNNILIERAVPINVFADGKQNTLMTYRHTVGEALENSPIKPSSDDKLEGASFSDKVVRDMAFKVVRVKKQIIKEDIPVPFQTVTRANDRLDKGVERVIKEGSNGKRQKSYEVVLEDGKETAKRFINEAMLSQPIDKIVELGTVLCYKSSRGDTVRYKKILSMNATAYTASVGDTGKSPGDPGYGITCTGTRVRKGIIAVDPRIIPLHTRVYVEVAGSIPDYGFAVAEDTGSAIKGNIIDLYYDSQGVVNDFGRQRVKVYVLADQ
ncbi:MAG TPA: G5 domain-containing protein [Clostridia bacterium]